MRTKKQIQGSKKGGVVQSKILHHCTLCDQVGFGNRFKQYHLDTKKCNGRGVKNYYAKLLNKRISNLW